jgi:hypothetical protein
MWISESDEGTTSLTINNTFNNDNREGRRITLDALHTALLL